MDYKEFTRNVGKSGLKLYEFADLLKMSPKSISNLRKKNDVPKHLAIISVLLGEMGEMKIDYRSLIENIGIERYSKNMSAEDYITQKNMKG